MTDTLVIAALIVAFGGVSVLGAREPYDRYATLADVASEDEATTGEPGEETVVRGAVEVAEPATPDRTPPESVDRDEDGGAPALWAWRIRRKIRRGGSRGGTRWRTVDGGLAVGEFAVRRDWERVRVDRERLPDPGADPFDASNLYLDPERDVPLGKLDPINERLERWGLAGEDGILSDWEVTISVGGRTSTPDRYQDAAVREGDELLVRGELAETADGPVVRGTDETPLLIADGDIEERADRLRSSALKRCAFGIALIALAGAVLASGVL